MEIICGKNYYTSFSDYVYIQGVTDLKFIGLSKKTNKKFRFDRNGKNIDCMNNNIIMTKEKI